MSVNDLAVSLLHSSFFKMEKGMFNVLNMSTIIQDRGVTCESKGSYSTVVLKVDADSIYTYSKITTVGGSKDAGNSDVAMTCTSDIATYSEVVKNKISVNNDLGKSDPETSYYDVNGDLHVFMDKKTSSGGRNQMLLISEKYRNTPYLLGESYIRNVDEISSTYRTDSTYKRSAAGYHFDFNTIMGEMKSINFCDYTKADMTAAASSAKSGSSVDVSSSCTVTDMSSLLN